MSDAQRTESGSDLKVGPGISRPVDFLDQRTGIAKLSRHNLRKVFPDHWSFLLGEIALYSFIILLLSGVFLTLWFKPSVQEVTYTGSYVPMQGIHMSEAYASTLDLSFDIRGGLLMRQIHHWSAHLFIAAMMVHMLRIFFTGAFRKPREVNWLVGIGLLMFGTINGFTGYSLPDDLLSGTGLRFVDGLIRSIPVVGTYLTYFIFGGDFPGTDIIPRLYMVHILLIPGLILALITVHLALVVYHKHTQYPGPGRTNSNVVGYPLMPVYMAKAGGFFFVVFGVTTLMSAFIQINPVWLYGPYNPSQVGAGSQPDWYMGWLEGAARLMPPWETELFGYSIIWYLFIPGVVLMGLYFTLPAIYPFIERWITKDNREHHILDRPRNQPTRTGFGVAAIVFYGLNWLAGGNDHIAVWFDVSLNATTWFLRIAVILGPVAGFIITRRICIGLQRRDQERLLHGRETGIVAQAPNGEYYEVHEPISDDEAYRITSYNRQVPYEVAPPDEHGVPAPSGLMDRFRAKVSAFYFGPVLSKPTRAELEEAHAHHNGHNGHGELSEPHSSERTEVGSGH